MQNLNLLKNNGGEFLISTVSFHKKMKKIKAFIFDWDGVFNDSSKRGNGESYFTEVDSMGTNLLRFSGFLMQKEKNPLTALISGEETESAKFFLKREHFNFGYFKSKDKREALKDFCLRNGLIPEEIAFVFDDVLDLSVAESAGVRILVRRKANPFFMEYVKRNKFADYITGSECGNFALREACELMISMSGNYEEVMKGRTNYSLLYRDYINERNKTEPEFVSMENKTRY